MANDYTMSVPAAGKKYFGLGRDGSYSAARRGKIPTVNVGTEDKPRYRVPISVIERLLGLGSSATKAAE